MLAGMTQRYRGFAPFYDLLSGEYPVYRVGRVLGVESLNLPPGAQVLDIGCGTGLNFALLQRAVGPGGTIVGIDRSAEMLAQALRKAERRGWSNVILIQADATTLEVEEIRREIRERGGRQLSDAALTTYALSLMTPWHAAWDRMLDLTAPGGTLCVVDMQEPDGPFRIMTPLARLACRMGGADITAHPWQAVERDCLAVTSGSTRGGHLQVRTGRRQ